VQRGSSGKHLVSPLCQTDQLSPTSTTHSGTNEVREAAGRQLEQPGPQVALVGAGRPVLVPST
jgi:hypothetical protein